MTANEAADPSRWRRAIRWLRRRRGTVAFGAALLAGLVWVAWPHLSAGAAGLLAERRGHWVEWNYAVPEDRRRFAPLPTRAAVWRTPVTVSVNAGEFPFDEPVPNPEALSDALDRIERMPHVGWVGVNQCDVSVADARRLAALHRGDEVRLFDCVLDRGSLAPLAGRDGVTVIDLDHSALPAGELACFAPREDLLIVRLSGATGVGGQCVPFAGHAKLQAIWASDTSFGDADLAAVARCGNLRWLELNDTAVTDAGLTVFWNRDEPLWELALSDTAVTDAGFAALPPDGELAELRLAGAAVTDATVRRLAERCPSLEILDLAGTRVTDAALPHLARLTSLRRLDLTGAAVTAAAIDPSIDWPALEELSVSAALAPPDAPLRGWDFLADDGPKVTYLPPPERTDRDE